MIADGIGGSSLVGGKGLGGKGSDGRCGIDGDYDLR